ncbi:tetratricopeptide repeat protein [Haliangium sp.]|uniref:tetratricopeptide repeat protein n=1 Tax=Haliangium sp. TaxID=2663208 RepID=UPI003D1527E9
MYERDAHTPAGPAAGGPGRRSGERPAAPPPPPRPGFRPPDPLLPGSLVGRFVVHSRLGADGNAMLYRAHDPRLGQDITLKLWTVAGSLPAAATSTGQDVVNAVHALAKISHPNLAKLLDVGTRGAEVFVAMEMMPGPTLGDWLRAEPRPLADILAVFEGIGRGLVALHRAGVRHGELGPNRVVVCATGPARLRDFGLDPHPGPGDATATAPDRAPLPRPGAQAPTPPSSGVMEFGPDDLEDDDRPTEIDMDREHVWQAIEREDARLAGAREAELGPDLGADAETETTDVDAPPPLPPGAVTDPAPPSEARAESEPFSDNELATDLDLEVPLARVATADPPRPGAGPALPPESAPYAAPELRLGRPVDVRADQFAFCALLYEAVCGVLPVADGDPEVVEAALQSGRLTPPIDGRQVPAWLEALLRRGLTCDPGQRFVDMEALVDTLGSRRPRPSRLALKLFVIAVVLLAVGAGAVYKLWPFRPDCAAPSPALEAAWNPTRSVAVRARFAAAALSSTEVTAAWVTARLDDYGRGWAAMNREACEATHVHETQPEDVLARRQACLSDRLGHLDALARALAEAPADAALVENAPTVVLALPALAACGPDAELPPVGPDDADTQARLRALSAELARTRADLALGQGSDAEVDELTARADQADAAPVRAAAHQVIAALQRARGDHQGEAASLRRAIRLAAEAGDGEAEARAWVALVRAVGLDQRAPQDALSLRPEAEAAIARAGSPLSLRAALLVHLGEIMLALDRAGDADGLFGQAADLIGEVPADYAPLLATAMLGRARARRTRPHHGGDAQAQLNQLVSLVEDHLGPAHAALTGPLIELAREHIVFTGGFAIALERLQRALAIDAAFHGARTSRAGHIEHLRGVALYGRGDTQDALAALSASVAILSERGGSDDPALAETLLAEARIRSDLGDYRTARARAERAVALRTGALGDDHPDTAMAEAWLHRTSAELSQPRRAAVALDRIVDTLAAARGPRHPDTLMARRLQAAALRASNRHGRALRQLDRVLAGTEAHFGASHPLVAEIQREIGDIQSERGNHREAQAAYQAAREIHAARGDRAARELARVLTGLGECAAHNGKPSAARPMLEQALELHLENPGDPLDAARTRFALAQVLRQGGGDAERAQALGREAAVALADAGHRGADRLAAVQAWLLASPVTPVAPP